MVATYVENHRKQIEDEGFKLLAIRLRRGMRSPIQELAAFMELVDLYRREKPDLVHHVGMKNVLFGAIAAHIAAIPERVHAITGLGYLFHGETWRSKLLRSIIKPVLKRALKSRRSVVILQNDEDCCDLIRAGVITESQAVIIRGAGVDASQYRPSPTPYGKPVVVLASRMLKNKGVGEFVSAARLLKAEGIGARCVLVGAVDSLNPTSFTQNEINDWVKEGIVEWWGHQDDMANVFASSHIVVLPSYCEGLPKVLLEAAACSKPLITTRVRGCQDVVRHGENGLLVPVKDSQSLAEAIRKLVQDESLRIQMGTRAREIVLQEFTCKQIAEETLDVYHQLGELSGRSPLVCSQS